MPLGLEFKFSACRSKPGCGFDMCSSHLWNAGNLCFFNSLMQALSYTPRLPKALCQGFPNVPGPPSPSQDEPLMIFTPASQKKPTPAAEPPKPVQLNASPSKTELASAGSLGRGTNLSPASSPAV